MENEVSSAKLSKHVTIHNAMNNTDMTIARMENFFARITNSDNKLDSKENQVTKEEPSLHVILNEGSTRINSQNSRLNELITEIEEYLF